MAALDNALTGDLLAVAPFPRAKSSNGGLVVYVVIPTAADQQVVQAATDAALAAVAGPIAGKAGAGDNGDISRLLGVGGLGIDFLASSTTVASAATADLGALTTRKVQITGTASISSFGTQPHRERLIHFAGACTVVHNATSLILPGGANILTAAGDTALATSDASGNWRVRHYQRASGKPVTGPAAADITDASASGRGVLTGTAAQGATALGVGAANIPTFAGLNVATTGDAALSFEAAGAPASTYRRKSFLSSVNIGGGSDTLLRATRPSDAAFLDYLFSASAPGTVLTTGSTAVSPTFAGLQVGTSFMVQAGNQGIELGRQDGTAVTPFIDFHANATPTDFDARILASGGSGSATGTATLNFLATNFAFNGGLTLSGPATFLSTIRLASYTVGTLPAGAAAGLIYVSNARKVGEGSGSGTGVVAYYSNGNWRRLSDDSPVAA